MQAAGAALEHSFVRAPIHIQVYLLGTGWELEGGLLAAAMHRSISAAAALPSQHQDQLAPALAAAYWAQQQQQQEEQQQKEQQQQDQEQQQQEQQQEQDRQGHEEAGRSCSLDSSRQAGDQAPGGRWLRWLEGLGELELDDLLHTTLLTQQRHYAQQARQGQQEGGPGQYLVLVLPRSAGAQAAEGGEVVVGGHRHAWVWTMPEAWAGADGVGESDLQQLLEGRVAVAMGRTFAALSDPHTAQALAAQLPTSASGQTLLAFALLNSEGALPLAPPPQPPGPAPRSPGPPVGEAAEGSPEPPAQGPNPDLAMPPLLHWRFAAFQHRYLAPLQQALAPLMQVGVSSQVQVLSPARVTPRWHAGLRAWVVRSKRWTQYADPDWGVGAGLGAVPWTMLQQQKQQQQQRVHPAAPPACHSVPLPAHVPVHVLHMVLHAPKAAQQPTLLLQPDGSPSPTNSFTTPSWGAVHVMPAFPASTLMASQGNPSGLEQRPHDSSDPSPPCPHHPSSLTSPPQPSLTSLLSPLHPPTCGPTATCPDSPLRLPCSSTTPKPPQGFMYLDDHFMHTYAGLVLAQLRLLLGLRESQQASLEQASHPSLPHQVAGLGHTTGSVIPGGTRSARGQQQGQPGSGMRALSPPSGVSVWEVDGLVQARAAYDIASAARLLASLSRLVQSLPNLAMPDVLAAHVRTSLTALTAAVALTQQGRGADAAAQGRLAHAHAQAAVSHPAVLAQLSFPESHKVGVYMPFFLPVLLALVQILGREVWYIADRRKKSWLAMKSKDPLAGLSVDEADRLHMLRAFEEKSAEKADRTSQQQSVAQ
ncbi:phosphatidylinositol-glycan biosynthesis class S protein-domain-containing protein [Haematococcus lacustris]